MNLTPTYYGSAATALTGLVIWILSTYVFHGDTPPVVATTVYVIVPGIVGGVIGFLTRKDAKTPAASATVTGKVDGHDEEGSADAGVRPPG